MQRTDDSPKSPRPSLLTPAQQAVGDRNRILSMLESGGWRPGRWARVRQGELRFSAALELMP